MNVDQGPAKEFFFQSFPEDDSAPTSITTPSFFVTNSTLQNCRADVFLSTIWFWHSSSFALTALIQTAKTEMSQRRKKLCYWKIELIFFYFQSRLMNCDFVTFSRCKAEFMINPKCEHERIRINNLLICRNFNQKRGKTFFASVK